MGISCLCRLNFAPLSVSVLHTRVVEWTLRHLWHSHDCSISTMYYDKHQLTDKQQMKITPDFYKNVYDCTSLLSVKCVTNHSSDSSGSHLFVLLLLSQFITFLLQLENGRFFISHCAQALTRSRKVWCSVLRHGGGGGERAPGTHCLCMRLIAMEFRGNCVRMCTYIYWWCHN